MIWWRIFYIWYLVIHIKYKISSHSMHVHEAKPHTHTQQLHHLCPWRSEMSDWIVPERLVTAATRLAMPCRLTSFRRSSISSRRRSKSNNSRCLFSFFSSQLLRALANTEALRIMLDPRFRVFLLLDSESWSSSVEYSVPEESDLSTDKQTHQVWDTKNKTSVFNNVYRVCPKHAYNNRKRRLETTRHAIEN